LNQKKKEKKEDDELAVEIDRAFKNKLKREINK